MSLKGVIEVVLRLESYHIIEYPHQGLFSFHCILYQQLGSTRRCAIPYQLLPRITQETNPRIILEPRIDDQITISSTGLAKYSDEVLTLQNWVQLRLEVQAYPELSADSVFLQIQLRFNKTNLSQPQNSGQLLETVTIRLNDLENGIFSYYEVEFTSPYLSRLRLTLLTFLSSFRFAKYDGPRDTPASKERANITSLDELLKYAQRELPTETPQKLFYSSYVKKLRIAQYLFADKITQLRKQPQGIIIRLPQDYLEAQGIQKPIERDLKHYLDHYFPQTINLSRLLQQLNSIRQENFDSLQELLSLWRSDQLKENHLKEEFQLYEKEKYGERVFRSVVQSGIEEGKREKVGYRENKKIAKEIRGKNLVLNSYSLEDVRDQQSRDEQELVFYQVSLPSDALPDLAPSEMKIAQQGRRFQYSEKHMLVVLCHGFQGSSQDMLLVKRWIQNQLPEAYYLIARSNQDDTEGDIRAMGKRLADEIQKFISNYMEEYQGQNVIINMVGHSMGGIVARAAIPHLQKYQSHMGFFCSLGSPHLGYLNGVSGLVKVGLWAIRKWKKVQSLEQLSMDERGDPRKTFLYQLSKIGHLKHFRKIILLCSFEDSYSPWHSARISGHRSKNSLTKVEQEMIDNILGCNVYGVGVHRLDVNFNVKTNNLDSFIGRTAHINLIVRDNLFKMLGTTLPKLFDLTEYDRQNLFL